MEENCLTGLPSVDKPWLNYYDAEAAHASLPACTLYELLWESNKDHLEDIALNYYQNRLTYAELFRGIDRTMKSLSALGVKQGDIVVVCTVNTPEMVYLLYALNRLGAVANMIDPRTNVDGIREYILESDARLVVTVDMAYPAIAKAIRGTEVRQVVAISPADSLPGVVRMLYRLKNKTVQLGREAMNWKEFLRRGQNATPVDVPYQKDTCCVMAHTGGTTGFPKAVMLSNDNINAMTYGYRYVRIPFARKQRYFNDLPPFIMYGLCLCVHTTLVYGLEVILYPLFDSKDFPRQFVRYMPHHFSALSDHLKYLASDKVTSKTDLSHLITAAVGGDALNQTLEREVNVYLKARGCKYEATKGYGMTELAATATTSTPEANAIGSVGIPLACNTIKIVDPDTGKELGYNQTGEIWISGPTIMLGYYNKPEETAELIQTDDTGRRWVHTGDLGHISPEGLLFHEGRIRRIYMTAHEGQPAKIFPMVVEDALKQSPGVGECSVVGRKRAGSAYYEAVAYLVKRDKGADEDALRAELAALCAQRVPTYMIPEEYRFLDELPHTPIGKVDFRRLEKEAVLAQNQSAPQGQ